MNGKRISQAYKEYAHREYPSGHYVYKYVCDGEIIYIGKTNASLPHRLSQHGKIGDNIPETAWNDLKRSTIYFARLHSRKACDIYEVELIRRYKPKYNKLCVDIQWDGLNMLELNWSEYKTLVKFKEDVQELYNKYIKLLQDNFIMQEMIQELQIKVKYYEMIRSKEE